MIEQGFLSNPEPGFSEVHETHLKMLQQQQLVEARSREKRFPFNPNYIDDYKGYVLGMSASELDRLKAFRAQGNFVNNALEFQQVTGISDSLLDELSPFFKFPAPRFTRNHTSKKSGQPFAAENSASLARQRMDLNLATPEDLRRIRGVGEVLSHRIVKFRNSLGGFLSEEQLYDVYGLERSVAERTLVHFGVLQRPDIQKINLNTASVDELSGFTYFSSKMARKIVAHREAVGLIRSFDELSGLTGFPEDKIAIIRLYLSL